MTNTNYDATFPQGTIERDTRDAARFYARAYGRVVDDRAQAYIATLAIERNERRAAGQPCHFYAIDRDLNG